MPLATNGGTNAVATATPTTATDNLGEIEANADVLYPLIDNMLFCRNQGLEALNKKYGLNIGVELNSSWDYRNDDSIESPDEDLKKSEKKVETPDQKEKKDI